jgi:hypothetical protein
MNENWKIIVKKASGFKEKNSQEGINASLTTKRWMTYLVLIPILILLAILGVFFFAAFLAVFTIAAVGFGIRFWWLKRELAKSVGSENPLSTVEKETVEGEYVVVDEDDQAAEEKIRRDGADN